VASGTVDSSNGFRIELLGTVEARVDGRTVALGGQRPRALLAILALMAGRVVAIDQLIDELWGEQPPVRARDSLQMHVSRLRKGLTDAGEDGGRLVSHAGGYLLEVRPGECDIDRWQQAVDRARRARLNGEPRDAREGFEEALGVWRGQPMAGVSTNSLLAAARARLEEERLAAVIEGIELDLELGRQGELLGQLEALVISHPFKERLVELQMLALYRCGRQANALAAFHAARGRFVDELGIEPAQALRELHEDVLTHSAELSPPAEKTLEGAAAPDDAERAEQPQVAGAAQPHDRSRPGRRRDRRAVTGRVGAAAHPHRAWRGRQDTTGRGGRARGRGGLRRRRALRLARRAVQTRGGPRGDRQGARDHCAFGRVRRPGRRTFPGRQASAADNRQPRAAARGRAVHRRTA
jgi:DNA-binding SARP family transcriptional activator